MLPLCGGNIDTTVLGRCLERGLAADGRLVKFTVTVSDRPGGEGLLVFFFLLNSKFIEGDYNGYTFTNTSGFKISRHQACILVT